MRTVRENTSHRFVRLSEINIWFPYLEVCWIMYNNNNNNNKCV